MLQDIKTELILYNDLQT